MIVVAGQMLLTGKADRGLLSSGAPRQSNIWRAIAARPEDADALAITADIHVQPKYIFAVIDAGCAAVRVNPGSIKEFDGRVADVAKAAGAAGVPIRIGVNAGSLW